LDLAIGAYLLQAALVFGAPSSPGTYEKGLFCESVDLVERVAALADRGANPVRVVADINARLGQIACIYATKPEVRARTVRFEKSIERTEIGDIAWTFPQPLTMYTLRAAAPARTVSH
jgi:hypothetical protein